MKSRALTAAATMFAMFVFAVSANVLPAVLLRAAAELQTDSTALSLAASLQFTGFFLATLIGGVICDRAGKKAVFVTASALMMLGSILASLAGSSHGVGAGCALLGMGGGIMEGVGAATLADLFPARRKLMLNLSQVIFCVGAVGGPLVVGWALPLGISWRLCFGMVGVLSFMTLILYAISHLPDPAPEDQISLDHIIPLLKRRRVIIPCLTLFCYIFAECAAIMYVNYYLRVHLGAPERWAIAAISAIWCTMGIGRLACAAIPEHHSYEKALRLLMLALAVFMIAQAGVSDWRASFALFVAAGLACSGIWPMLVGLTASRAHAHTATIVGFTIAIGSLGAVITPPAMRLFFATLPANWVFPLAALPLLFGALILQPDKKS